MAVYRCEICNSSFNSKFALNNHKEDNICINKLKQKIGVFKCDICKKSYSSKKTLYRHIQKRICIKHLKKALPALQHEKEEFACNECDKKFINRKNFVRHKQLFHLGLEFKYPCGSCSLFFSDTSSLDTHRRLHHAPSNDIYERQNVLRGTCRVYRYDVFEQHASVDSIIPSAHDKFLKLIEHLKHEMHSFKFTTILGVEFDRNEQINKPTSDAYPERMIMNFRSNAQTVYQSDDADMAITKALHSMEANSENFAVNGSGWQLRTILYIDLEIARCHILAGSDTCSIHVVNSHKSSRRSFQLRKKRSIDQEIPAGRCFFHAIAAYFLTIESRCDGLEDFIEENINQTSVTYPVKVKDIPKFESANKHLNIGINVITKSATGHVFPLYISKQQNSKHVINLLLFYIGHHDSTSEKFPLTDEILPPIEKDVDHDELREVEASCKQHYALILDLDKEITKARKVDQLERAEKQLELKAKEIEDIQERIAQIDCDKVKHEQIIFNKSSCTRTIESSKKALICDSGRRLKELDKLGVLQDDFKRINILVEEYRTTYENDSNASRRIHACYNCLSIYSTQQALSNHQKWCFKEKPSGVILPTLGEKMEFEPKRKNNFTRIQMFFDFECLQVKPEHPCSCRPQLEPKCWNSISNQEVLCKHSSSTVYEQKPFSYCLLVCSNEFEVLDIIQYAGEDASDHFIDTLLDMELRYRTCLKNFSVSMIFEERDKLHFDSSDICHICSKIIKKDEKKVRDHG